MRRGSMRSLRPLSPISTYANPPSSSTSIFSKNLASALQPTTHLLPNYYNVTGTFGDSSSSALLAATAYRIASLGRAKKSAIVETAESIRVAIYANVNPTTGWLSPVVVSPHSRRVRLSLTGLGLKESAFVAGEDERVTGGTGVCVAHGGGVERVDGDEAIKTRRAKKPRGETSTRY